MGTTEHASPCRALVEVMERIAVSEQQHISDHSWISDIDKDIKNIMNDITRLKVQLSVVVAIATILANLAFGAFRLLFPQVYAGP